LPRNGSGRHHSREQLLQIYPDNPIPAKGLCFPPQPVGSQLVVLLPTFARGRDFEQLVGDPLFRSVKFERTAEPLREAAENQNLRQRPGYRNIRIKELSNSD